MKKLLLIIFVLALALAAFAQTDITIGTGTSTGRYPFNDYFVYSRSQCIYLESEIGAPGTIHKLRWYRNDTGADPLAIGTTQIWLKTVSNAVMTDATWEDPGTMVAEITDIDLGAGDAWYEIDITDFAYSGGNLLVSVYTQDAPYTSPHSYWRYTATTGFNRCRLGNSDSSNPPTLSLSTSRPNLQLNMTTGAPSMAPNAAILAAPLNGGWAFLDAVLSWNSGGGFPATYDVYFDTVDGSTLVSDDQAGLTYTPSLAPGTTYYWKVVATNSFGDSPASAVWSFQTPTATQLAESFEPTAFPPAGWANGTTGTWSRSTSYYKHGVASAYKYGSTTTAYQLSTPRLTITPTSTLDIWTLASSATGTLQVVYSPDRVTWTPLGTPIAHATTYTWYNTVADLSSLAGNNYYLGIQTGLQSASFYVDLVVGPEITPEAPGAPVLTAPADLAINVTEYPTLTWTAPTTGGVPTGYNIYLDTVDGTTLYASNVTSPYTPASALAFDTTYYWTVEAYNGAGTGPQATVSSFTTRANPTISTFPWEVTFGTVAADWPVLNWSQLINQYGTALTAGTRWYQDDFVNVTTPLNKAGKMNVWSANYGWLVTPPIAIPATGYELKFDLGLTAYGSTSAVTAGGQPDDKFMVMISDSPMMTNPTVLKEWNNSGSANVYDAISNTGENHIIDLDAYVGTKYIAFYGETSVSNGDNDLFVDNVIVRETPAAPIFSYAPTSIDFGMVQNGVQAGPQNVTITNTGGGTLNIAATDISIAGTNAAEFSFATTNLPAALAGGQSVVIPVYVTGVTEGAISATLTIVNAETRTNYDVALAATVLPAGIVVIGNGTANNNLPVNPFWGYTYSQSIFLQSELNTADQRIEKIWYYWNGVAEAVDSNDWTIYMGHTAATEFASTTDWVPLANLSTVFTGTVALPATAGWIEITLDSPFIYNNTDNLVIAVDENADSYDGSSEFFYSTAAATNRSLRYYSDGTNPDPAAPVAGTLVLGYPNLMLQFGDIPSGAPGIPVLTYPSDSATDLPISGFDLTWTAGLEGGTPDYYAVYIASTMETIYSEQYFETYNTHFNPVTEGGMTFSYEDRWYWTVQAFNASGDAIVDPPYNFQIQADPRINLPYAQDFGTDATPVWPSGWTQSYQDGVTSNRWTASATANAGGTANEMMCTWASGTGISRLITPPINTDGIANFSAQFNHYYNDYAVGATAKVQYSHDLATWYDTNWTLASGGGDDLGQRTALVLGINQPITYVAWVMDGNHFQFDNWYVDDVVLDLMPEHDVAPVSIGGFLGEVADAATPIYPTAQVANLGVNVETFTVTATWDTYTDTQTVTDLGIGQTATVTFAPFTPNTYAAQYFTVTTNLATDVNTANDVLQTPLITLPLDRPALASNLWTDYLVGFNLKDPGTLTDLIDKSAYQSLYAGDWMNGKWYACEDYDDVNLVGGNFWQIDPPAGTMTDLGDGTTSMHGLAWDDVNGVLYGHDAANLYTLNPATGAILTTVGPHGITYQSGETTYEGLVISIAYDNYTQTLYAVELGTASLYTLNVTTGAATKVGAAEDWLGIDVNYAQDMAFDQDTGLLYLAGYTNSTQGALYWIDTTYGYAWKVGPFQGSSEMDAFAIPYGDAFVGTPDVTIAADGTLSWPAINGAAGYYVYAADDPYGTYTKIATVYDLSWLDPNFPETMKFYQVVAFGGRAASNNQADVNINPSLRKTGTRAAGEVTASPADRNQRQLKK